MPDQTDVFYNAARVEMIERMKMRDTALLSYIVALGAYFSFLTSRSGWPRYSSIEIVTTSLLPIISLVFTFVIIQHHNSIGAIGAYIERELLHPNKMHWDASEARQLGKEGDHRFWAQFVVLAIPAAYELAYAANGVMISGVSTTAAWLLLSSIISFVLFGWIARLHILSRKFRKGVRDRLSEKLNRDKLNRV